MRIFILFVLLFTTVSGAIQLSPDCLKRPEACKNDEFSVADFLLCDVGDTVATEFTAQEGATAGTGLKGTCGFIETCVHVYPADEIDNATWTITPTEAGGGCEDVWLFVNGVGLDPVDANRPYTTAEDALWATKKGACQKWLNPTTGVCQTGGGGFIVVVIVAVLVGLGLIAAGVWFGFLKDPNNQPDWLSNLMKRGEAAKYAKLNNVEYKRRVRREFNDTI